MKSEKKPHQLYSFLEEEIGLSKEAIDLGCSKSFKENAPLLIVLRSLGLITKNQFEKSLRWLYK